MKTKKTFWDNGKPFVYKTIDGKIAHGLLNKHMRIGYTYHDKQKGFWLYNYKI